MIATTLFILTGLGISAAQAPRAMPSKLPLPKYEIFELDNPKFQSKGDLSRSYVFPETGERIPYHLYVPSKWSPGIRLPLVVVTHDANQPADMPFLHGLGALAKIAEQRGYIILGVTGYKRAATGVDGGYNNPFKMVPATDSTSFSGSRGVPVATKLDFERSEKDILYVTDIVAGQYNVDANRIYLMGNSAGGGAVWYLGEKYPERWTAVSPSAAPLADMNFPYDRLKKVPVLAVHGDADTIMSFQATKLMVDHAKTHGVDATLLAVPGGTHVDAWLRVLPQIFDFFDKHKTKQR
jgi:predicted peptidase